MRGAWCLGVVLGGLLWISSQAQDNEIIFFSDSPEGDVYVDASWGSFRAPSYLELAHTDKFPVDARHPFRGAHSLRLHWKSMERGDWGIAIASRGWLGYDFTKYDSIVYWINAPAAVPRDALPDLAIEDLSNKKSTRVWLGDYLDGVDGDSTTWQKVMVPTTAFRPGTQNCDFTRIKTIFHYQKAADGVEHLVWIDEVKVIKAGAGGPVAMRRPTGLGARGYDGRIDLWWTPNTQPELIGYYIYRASSRSGPYARVNPVVHETPVFSDYLGQNDVTRYYYVTAVGREFQESPPSDTVQATSRALATEELLSYVQEAAFRYFYHYGHPVSGLARERKGSGDVCTSGGTGFGLMTIMIGAERGFVPRDSAAARTLKILRFLQDVAPRYHGAWSHWINGSTGATIPFSQFDDGGDLVETAYVVQALLTIRNYYTRDNPIEREIRRRCTELWEQVEWDWYRRTPPEDKLYWHWSPNYGWAMNMPIVGFNEAMIVYLLAIASPTHPVPAELYYRGWAGSPSYVNGNVYYGYKQWVGPPYGGPLFFTHYSFLGFDPRDKSDAFCNYFENNRNITLIHRAYCMANPLRHVGYDSLVWGLTASDDPWGYLAHEPFNRDNGTITPTAAVSAIPYTPDESIATIRYFYYQLGPQLWSEFGFVDAFHLGQNWFATSVLAIDQGTMAPMIENYRTGLCWQLFMANPEIQEMLSKIGWRSAVRSEAPHRPKRFALKPAYPNPFNSSTLLILELPRQAVVTTQLFDVVGRLAWRTTSHGPLPPGAHRIRIDGSSLPTGVYLCRVEAGPFVAVQKLVLVR
ncbi:MAG: T9SS type A sorting domain-containing protein [candidate division KSB1 bacterium]|nr:T9SS type A sorting domain-containing protein [candidate division KSB1 bacterium]